MSDVYKFKAMSEVESLAEPTDTTTLLAVENGSVKQIPASAVGGGGGSFIVNLTSNEDMTSITDADKTLTEITTAISSGLACFAHMASPEGIFILTPLMYANDIAVAFHIENTMMGIVMMAMCMIGDDGADAWQLMASLGGASE